jgi:hypothetical protein
MHKRLRYSDLRHRGIVRNRTTLGNWIRLHGFPRGQLTGPNSRTWGEDEVDDWLDSRPVTLKPTPPRPPTSGRRRRSQSDDADTKPPGP